MCGDKLLIGNMNGQLGIYDLKGQILKSYKGQKNEQYMLDIIINSRNGRKVVIGGSESGEVFCWDLQSQKLILKKRIGDGVCSAVDYSHSLDLVVCAGTFAGLK